MNLTDPQKEYLTSAFDKFVEDLHPNKIKELYFRLDDLIQYGSDAVFVAYVAISKHLTKE